MCLSRVSFVNKSAIGYKYFVTLEDKLQTGCRFVDVELGKWITDSSCKNITANDGKIYPSGFHIMKTKKGAEHNNYLGSLYKVQYRSVVAEGFEQKAKVVVAREMKVLEKVK